MAARLPRRELRAWTPDRVAQTLVPLRDGLVDRFPREIAAARGLTRDQQELLIDEAIDYVVTEYAKPIPDRFALDRAFWAAASYRVRRVHEGRAPRSAAAGNGRRRGARTPCRRCRAGARRARPTRARDAPGVRRDADARRAERAGLQVRRAEGTRSCDRGPASRAHDGTGAQGGAVYCAPAAPAPTAAPASGAPE